MRVRSPELRLCQQTLVVEARADEVLYVQALTRVSLVMASDGQPERRVVPQNNENTNTISYTYAVLTAYMLRQPS